MHGATLRLGFCPGGGLSDGACPRIACLVAAKVGGVWINGRWWIGVKVPTIIWRIKSLAKYKEEYVGGAEVYLLRLSRRCCPFVSTVTSKRFLADLSSAMELIVFRTLLDGLTVKT